jgi:hypothetical protein
VQSAELMPNHSVKPTFLRHAAYLRRYATNLLHPLPESGDNMAIRCAAFNSFHAHVWGQGKAARMAWSKTWAREQRSVTALQC